MKCSCFVLKITECCNLACKYCYMFRGGDFSFKHKPKLMSIEIAHKAILRAKEHCLKHKLKNFNFVLHGGEPLIAGKKFILDFTTYAKKVFKDTDINVIVGLQTNGTLIDEEWCNIFKKCHINVGISINGKKEDHDKNRVDLSGRGTFDRVINAINLCKKNNIELGVLSVLNVNTDPTESYELYKSLNVKGADVLFLEANYDKLPPKPIEGKFVGSDTPAGDWLIKFFDLWYNDENNFFERHFSQYVKSILGAITNGDDLGESNNEILTIESNGEYESEDALRICGNDFTKTNINVFDSTVDNALTTKLSKAYYHSHKYLPKKCLACPIKQTCGGGYMPHRYSSLNGFNNPSIYCKDLLKLITHVQNSIVDSLANSNFVNFSLDKITYEEALDIIERDEFKIKGKSYFSQIECF